jgi:p38 MAP kinase
MEIQTLRFVQSLPKRQRVPFSEKLRCNDESALDLLEKMLVFDPRKRINASECLSHEYVAPYHDPTDEPVAAEKFDWSFNDADLPVDTWKVMMYAEILGAYNYSRIYGALMKVCIDFHEVTTDPAASTGAVPEGALTGPDDGYATAAARTSTAVAGSTATSTTTATTATTATSTNTTAAAVSAAPAAAAVTATAAK